MTEGKKEELEIWKKIKLREKLEMKAETTATSTFTCSFIAKGIVPLRYASPFAPLSQRDSSLPIIVGWSFFFFSLSGWIYGSDSTFTFFPPRTWCTITGHKKGAKRAYQKARATGLDSITRNNAICFKTFVNNLYTKTNTI